jgi:hypothetical protein
MAPQIAERLDAARQAKGREMGVDALREQARTLRDAAAERQAERGAGVLAALRAAGM